MIPLPRLQPFILMLDASGNWSCGAYYNSSWFQLQWDNSISDAHISAKELAPIMLAVAISGRAWKGHTVIRVLSDNTAAVAAINNQTLPVVESAHLLRCLAFLTTHYQCDLEANHIAGQHNTRADALSRNNLHMLHPQAHPQPSHLPDQLVRLLITEHPDWTSQRWTELWTDTLNLI